MDNNFFIYSSSNDYIVEDSLRESNDGHRRAMVIFNNKIKRKKRERDRKRDRYIERKREIVSRGKFYRENLLKFGFLKSYSFVTVALYNNYTSSDCARPS